MAIAHLEQFTQHFGGVLPQVRRVVAHARARAVDDVGRRVNGLRPRLCVFEPVPDLCLRRTVGLQRFIEAEYLPAGNA
ncbi:hypothetical protein J2X90_005121 [Variovorax paradoxus]|nr:hypothetical protein [Variovorax paradoxus]MDP9927918.1 hypothetical protein [Variovorax paradoxus]MDQ0027286.1 hypothetical protein [Variovorax paradoxus]